MPERIFMDSKKFVVKLLFFTLIFSVVACTYNAKVVRVYKEYIPPITRGGKDCIKVMGDKLKECNYLANKKRNLCLEEALSIGQKKYAIAMENYEVEKSKKEKQRVIKERKIKADYLAKKNEYEECLLRRNREIEKLKANYDYWLASGRYGMAPSRNVFIYCYSPSQPDGRVSTGMGFFIKPILSNFINYSHCSSFYSACEIDYDADYKKCSGNVLETTRCFADCDK